MTIHNVPTVNPITVHAVDPGACRALWCSVIEEQWKLAFNPTQSDRPFEIKAARRWFGSHDFAIATSLAGLDPATVYLGFQMRVARGACAMGGL